MESFLVKISLFFDNHKQKILFSVLGISLFFALTSLYQRQIVPDDAWFAEQAYSFAMNGYVKSELYNGMLGYENRHLAYHRLHIWQGALVYKIFGWSPYVFKLITLFYFCLFLILAYFYIKKFDYQSKNKYIFVLFYALAIVHAVTLEHAVIYRPDVFMMTLGFASFFLLHLSIYHQGWFKPFIAGILAGASVVAHLNGLVFVAAGAILLLFFRCYRLFFLFSVSSSLVSVLYFYEIQTKELFDLYLYQFANSSALSEKEFSLFGLVLKLLAIHGPYFRHPAEAAYTLLFLFVMWTQRKKINENKDLKIIFVYFFTIAIVLAIINPGAKTLYLSYHMPYAILLVSILFSHVYAESNKRKNWLLGFTVLYLLTQWGHAAIIFNRRTPELVQQHRDTAEKFNLVKGEKIIAPMMFIFNELENYKIQSFNKYYIDHHMGRMNFNAPNFFLAAQKSQRSFIIATSDSMKQLGLFNIKKGIVVYGYRYVGSANGYHGFRRIE